MGDFTVPSLLYYFQEAYVLHCFLQVCLEESVTEAEENSAIATETTLTGSTPQPSTRTRSMRIIPTTPSSSVANAVTGGSKADYTCYSICLSKGESKDKETDIVAVFIETKMQGRSDNLVAQVSFVILANILLFSVHPF